MWRATLRGLLAHKLRLALSGLAIVLGVAFVSGTMIFTDTLSRTFTSLFESTSNDVSVTRATAFEAGFDSPGGSASYVPSSLVEQISAVDGVAAAEGYVRPRASTSSTRPARCSTPAARRAVGVAGSRTATCRPAPSPTAARPSARARWRSTAGTVEDTGYAVGDRVTLLTPGPRVEAEVVGVFTFGDDGGLAGASLTAFDLDTAQALLGAGDGLTGIDVLAADGRSDAEVRDAVAAAVGSDYEVKTAAQTADDQTAALEDSLSFINVFLLVFAGVALFVGSFIILNTFSMLVAQRTRELALLRALGPAARRSRGRSC
jgi:putative ABC transport system permease protein